MNPAGHVMILASAGSGKTYALTNRFVGLLARGAAPERIAALTFTRKAAGEFFDEILKKLARAAAEDAYARQLAKEIGVPAAGREDFARLLRGMVEAMPRLNLGTLDSFFARIVRAFPLELGLGGEFEVLQEAQQRVERRRVLRRMFAPGGGDGARQDFIEAFKRATFGTEEKRLGARLDAFLDGHAEVYQAAPDRACWGRAERIWPAGCPWLAAVGRRATAAAALREALPWAELGDKARQRWEGFFAELPGWSPGAPLPKPVAYVVRNAFAAWPGLAEIVVERKKLPLAPAAAAALRELLTALVGAELARRLEMTQGIFAVLDGYETFYDTAVRRAGRLTFVDVQRLLRPDAPGGARMLTREQAEEARLYIDWRLDAQIDHWLLDEFQDTSFGQWSVLRNLIDEAVQDPTGERTLFYVGDVKQAIYGWREGDARLFREIFDHYNSSGISPIREERLDQSWRSGPAVIAMVNRVFGDAAALGRLFPAEVVDRWTREWRDHTSARPGLGGYAALHHAEDEAGRFAETLRIIRETGATGRGLEVAVLVQKNDTAAALADFLRREGGLAAVAESDRAVALDNPLSAALLALLRAAAHPGDRAARVLVDLTPLGDLLKQEELAEPDRLTRRLLAEIHEDGFARTLESWLARLEAVLAPGDAFSRERGRQLVEAARLFDETGARDVAEFVQFAEKHTVREAEAAGVVRVMTVHKSKGLGFDLVILPDLEGTKLAARRRGLAVQRAPDRSVEWVLDLPSEVFHAQDEVLSAHVAQAEADACYEELAVLYVAMTRAKRALYVVTEPVGTSQSHNFSRLLQETLGDTWVAGEARWYASLSISPPAAAAPDLPVLAKQEARPVRRHPVRTPSALRQGGETGGARLFSLAAVEATEFGRDVHALLARVEWGGADRAADFGEGAAAEEARACVLAPALAEVWARPAPTAEVWREQAFEILLDGNWVSGIFDRVVIVRDAAGRAVAARVFDFKTDRGDGGTWLRLAARHAEQIGLYRRVVAVLTGLSLEAVVGELVFTAGRRVVAPTAAS